ncbi:Protein of unknown function [Gryllus bimaculatus]|nr:Protein of unknown function [Gryllus bimaculatus]
MQLAGAVFYRHPPSVPPPYQPPRVQHDQPGRPPVSTAALGPEDYGRYAAPFILAYPMVPWTAGGWKGNSPPLAPPPLQQANGDPRPQEHNVPRPQQYPPPSTLLQAITTTPPSPHPGFDTRSKEVTTTSPPYPDNVMRSEKLITTSPPQHPDLETHSATSETLQTF